MLCVHALKPSEVDLTERQERQADTALNLAD
jgi:hypothetical protein